MSSHTNLKIPENRHENVLIKPQIKWSQWHCMPLWLEEQLLRAARGFMEHLTRTWTKSRDSVGKGLEKGFS